MAQDNVEKTLIKIGVLYLKKYEADPPGFVKILENCFSIVSVGYFFYSYLVGRGLINSIETVPESEKMKYWDQVSRLAQPVTRKVKICKTIYSLIELKKIL